MRTVAFLLSLMILMLMIKPPCADEISTEDHANIEARSTHDHENGLDDSCAHSCICICCSPHIINEHKIRLTLRIPNQTSPILRTTYISFYRFDFFHNIWQPPQLIG